MKSATIRGGIVAAVATFFVLGVGAATPLRAQQGGVMNSAPAEQSEWDPRTTYAKDDIVTARGSSWISLKAGNKNKVPGQTSPSTAAFWELFARGFNPTGAWSNTTKYQPDDLVTSNGQTYRAKLTNQNKQPTNAANWELLVTKGAKGDQGDTGPAGAAGATGAAGVAGATGQKGNKGDKGDKGDTGDTGYRDLMIAATILVSVLCLICEQSYSPTPGYSLAPDHSDLQLSP